MPPGQQQIEDHPQRVDIRRGRDRAAGQLLGRGILRRQDPLALARQGGHRVGVTLRFEQLGDAELEEFDLAVARVQHVRRL